jgi:Domain of unknown function (DUF4939)
MQERSAIVKALDFYYRDKSKLDSFLISIDIYILFNQYLFGTKAAKVVYTVSYLRGVAFNWVKTYIEDFMAHKNSDEHSRITSDRSSGTSNNKTRLRGS